VRNKNIGIYNFSEVFKNLEDCRILWKVFGTKEKFLSVLKNQKVRVSKKHWIFWVNDKTKKITIFVDYLKKCPKIILYLDCIHELVHVKQMIEGKELFDKEFSYFDRPTEIEAYIIAAKEAKRIGMSRRQISNYLKVDWQTKKENEILIEAVLSKI
jgi:hypothetical protein